MTERARTALALRRRRAPRALSTLVGALAVALVLSAPGQTSVAARDRPAAGRDTVVIGTIQEPAGVHPLFHIGGIASGVLSTLFTADVEWNTFSGEAFAQGVEYLPNVRDGTWTVNGEKMTLRWKLKPRTWHDGRPVTCGDYVFTYRVMRDERVPGFVSRRESVRRIANVLCPRGESGTEVVVNWTERSPLATQAILAQFDIWVALPRHVLEPSYRASPARFDQTPYGHDPRATIGDGPYRWIEWHKGESLTVETVPGHPIFGTPQIKRIVWRFLPDPDTLVDYLLSGTVDAISGIGVTVDQAVGLERRAGGRVKVFTQPAPLWEHIDFNLDHPLLRDLRVRRAIAHAVNRTQIVQQLFFGRLRVAHTYLPPGNPGYTEQLQKYSYDPARVRALLREAGFAPGHDGIMRHATGQRLSLTLSTTAGDRRREQMQQIIRQQLGEIGIEITIVNFPGRVFFGQILPRRTFTLALYAFGWPPMTGCRERYTSSEIPAEPNLWTGQNYPGYGSAEMDRVCTAAAFEVDPEKRTPLLRESAKIFARDLPALPLYYRAATAAAKVGLENFPGPGVLTSMMWNVHTWYWR